MHTLIRCARPKSVESVVVTTKRGEMTDVALFNFRHFWVPLYLLEVLVNSLFLIFLIAFGSISRKSAVFHVHGAANIAPIIAARLVGVPVVWNFHETTPEFGRLVRFGLVVLRGHPHELVVVASKSKDVYELGNAELVPVAIDEGFWSRELVGSEREEHCMWHGGEGAREERLRILAVGNLNPLKGMDILLEAVGKLDRLFHVKIIGAELDTHQEYADDLYRLAGDIVAAKQGCEIEFLGWKDKKAIRALLASCDVFVLPSRSEACPTVLLEAMAMDCVCIASDVGDVKVMLSGYACGNVFLPEDIGSLVRKLSVVKGGGAVVLPKEQKKQSDSVYRLEVTSRKMLMIYGRLI